MGRSRIGSLLRGRGATGVRPSGRPSWTPSPRGQATERGRPRPVRMAGRGRGSFAETLQEVPEEPAALLGRLRSARVDGSRARSPAVVVSRSPGAPAAEQLPEIGELAQATEATQLAQLPGIEPLVAPAVSVAPFDGMRSDRGRTGRRSVGSVAQGPRTPTRGPSGVPAHRGPGRCRGSPGTGRRSRRCARRCACHRRTWGRSWRLGMHGVVLVGGPPCGGGGWGQWAATPARPGVSRPRGLRPCGGRPRVFHSE